jgi:hypothetical protein
VQVPYSEGVTTHIGPEPCADVRKGVARGLHGHPLNRERPIAAGRGALSPTPAITGYRYVQSWTRACPDAIAVERAPCFEIKLSCLPDGLQSPSNER